MADKELNNELSVGEVARRAGISVSALHFYESKGLIPKAQRNAANQRRYPRAVLRIVSLVKVAQGFGFSLMEIKHAFNVLPKNGEPSKEDWVELGRMWKRDLDTRIRLLTQLRNHLNDCIGCGCLITRSCPLRNPGDKLAKKGSGPHLLK